MHGRLALALLALPPSCPPRANADDAWGREASTLRFSVELTGRADNIATVTPEVTVTWS